jgi:hypothetical protein
VKIHGDPGGGYHVDPNEAWHFVLVPVVCFVAAIAISLAWRLIAVNHFGARPLPPKTAMQVLLAAYGFFGLPEKSAGTSETKPRPIKLRLLEMGIRFVPLAGALVADGVDRAW